MKKYLVIKADTNDADYITQETLITDDSQIDKYRKVFEAIKNFKPYKILKGGLPFEHDHNFPVDEMCRKDLGAKSAKEMYGHLVDDWEKFMELIPVGEYGIHTIKSARIIVVESEEVLV